MSDMQLDHLSYVAGPEGLGACAQRLGSWLGAGFRDGGLHPAFGTRNFVLPLTANCYLEVVAPLDHPAADRAPFGRAVQQRAREGGGWLAWAVRVDDITPIEVRLDRPARHGHRRRPDGVVLSWWQLGIRDVTEDPQLPFFIQWESEDEYHPSVGGEQIALRHLEIAGDEATVDGYLGVSAAREPLDGVQVAWVDSYSEDDGRPETGLVAAVFDTPNGEIRID